MVMAKKRETVIDEIEKETKAKPKTVETTVVVEEHHIAIPVQPEAGVVGFRVHVDVELQSHQATTLNRIKSALDGQQAKLANGKRVVNYNDTIKWLLEQVESSTA